MKVVRWFFPFISILVFGVVPVCAQRAVGNPPSYSLKSQPYQRAEACVPCHQRQYDELQISVKSGYRNVSPLFNSLEMASNFLTGGAIRPVYSDSTKVASDGTPLRSSMFTTPLYTNLSQVQAGFCLSCHNPHIVQMGNDAQTRDVPELAHVGADFQPELFRPLRDYALVDAAGHQVLPTEPGGPVPPGAGPSLGAQGISCDVCHNVTGPDLDRSFQRDGFANTSLKLLNSVGKVGPFPFPVAAKGNFHVVDQDPQRRDYLRSANFCNACHDVRVPGTNLMAYETDINAGGSRVTHYRLENLSTEWTIGAYNSTNNPFGKVVRCQDCHMSLYPYAGNTTYQVGELTVTSPTPSVFPTNYAAVPGVSTEFNFPLPKRQVVTHYLTGIDVPLLSTDELRTRLRSNYPDVNDPGQDEYGTPLSLATRREDLLKAAVRVYLDKTDQTVQAGGKFEVRVTAVSLSGHRFPAGFSQERTGYINLTVKDKNGFLIYQSGYQVDKPHPDTGENAPDGNLDDEDLEHIVAIVNPGQHTDQYVPGPNTNGHTNQVFWTGIDNGPDSRVYVGAPKGLVLFRNELTHIYLPGENLGRADVNGNPIKVTRPHFEETFSAAFANAVDNFRSLQPLRPTTFRYEIQLPTPHELEMLGIDHLEGPLQVEAKVDFEHFPPLFVRFLARVGSVNGPGGRDFHILSESTVDEFLKNVRSIATASITVNLVN
jgi:hypothetical protein